MKIGIFYKQEKVRDEEVPRRLQAAFGERGVQTAVFRSETEIGGVDRLLVLGGDGTVLRAARVAAEQEIPLVAVNYGTLGFLTEFERGETAEAVDLILDADARTVRRTMLEIGLDGKTTHCLNEMVLQREHAPGVNSKIARITVYIDGSSAGDFAADGMIVSTPTGSTAYSLSAGGSILCPECSCFLLTPLCAFSLRSRPIVYSDASVLSFRLPQDQPMVIYGDGKYLGNANGKELTVRRSARAVTFLCKRENDFFRRLSEKLG